MTVRQPTRGAKTPLGGAWDGRLRLSPHPKEASEVLPPPCHHMAHDPSRPFAPVAQAARHRFGPGEAGDGAGALLGVDRRQGRPGDLAGPPRPRRVSAVARGGLRGPRPTRLPPVCARRGTRVVPLLGGGVPQWEGTQLALAREATPVGPRCTVLALSGVSRGGALPVAWTVVAATAQQAWRRAGWRRLRQGHRAVPRSWPVVGLADRGLGARWGWRRLPRLGGHPFLRITLGGTLRPTGQVRGVSLQPWVPEPGTPGQGPGIAWKGRQRHLPCPLLACGGSQGITPPGCA